MSFAPPRFLPLLPAAYPFLRAFLPLHSLSSRRVPARTLAVSASLTAGNSADPNQAPAPNSRRWTPTCLYHIQGKCAKMDDALHLEKFNHNILNDLQINQTQVCNVKPQKLDYFLILDLEGKVEILEFPVVMIDARNMEYIDSFHRFVRPSEMSDHRINEYIEGKYGKIGVGRVWHDTAIPFRDVIHDFEIWMTKHQLWNKMLPGPLHRAAFVTCGNWDLKTKVPQQCKVSQMKTPEYFMEWINLKDIYLNFYKRRATGMRTMMRELEIPLLGSHHLGIDDAKNIARVAQRLLADGAVLQVTARSSSSEPDKVKYLFVNRIK